MIACSVVAGIDTLSRSHGRVIASHDGLVAISKDVALLVATAV